MVESTTGFGLLCTLVYSTPSFVKISAKTPPFVDAPNVPIKLELNEP